VGEREQRRRAALLQATVLQGDQEVEGSSRVVGVRLEERPVALHGQVPLGVERSEPAVHVAGRRDIGHDRGVAQVVSAEQAWREVGGGVAVETLVADHRLAASRPVDDQQVGRCEDRRRGTADDALEHLVDVAAAHEVSGGLLELLQLGVQCGEGDPVRPAPADDGVPTASPGPGHPVDARGVPVRRALGVLDVRPRQTEHARDCREQALRILAVQPGRCEPRVQGVADRRRGVVALDGVHGRRRGELRHGERQLAVDVAG
jgi:hypothetical protein